MPPPSKPNGPTKCPNRDDVTYPKYGPPYEIRPPTTPVKVTSRALCPPRKSRAVNVSVSPPRPYGGFPNATDGLPILRFGFDITERVRNVTGNRNGPKLRAVSRRRQHFPESSVTSGALVVKQRAGLRAGESREPKAWRKTRATITVREKKAYLFVVVGSKTNE